VCGEAIAQAFADLAQQAEKASEAEEQVWK
jgi:hypothetical protein